MLRTIDSVMAIPKECKISTLGKKFKLNREKEDFIPKNCTRLCLPFNLFQHQVKMLFSVASNFLNKLCNQLKVETLGSLVFLKYYFINQK